MILNLVAKDAVFCDQIGIAQQKFLDPLCQWCKRVVVANPCVCLPPFLLPLLQVSKGHRQREIKVRSRQWRVHKCWGRNPFGFFSLTNYQILRLGMSWRAVESFLPKVARSPRFLRTAQKHPAEPTYRLFVVFGDASLAQSSSRLRRVLDEFRERDQRSIAETLGGKPLLGALLTVDQGIETHDPRAEPLNDLTAGRAMRFLSRPDHRAGRPTCLVAGGCRQSPGAAQAPARAAGHKTRPTGGAP